MREGGADDGSSIINLAHGLDGTHGVAETSITRVIRPLLPMYVAMVLALVAVTYVPWLSLWLPGLFGF